MTNSPAAIRAVLVDVRNINTDKEVRLELRVPAELAGRIFEAFGWPTKVAPVEVAIARLEPAADPQALQTPPNLQTSKPPEDRKSFLQMRRSAQAALRCREPLFREFLADRYGRHVFVSDGGGVVEGIATHVRVMCGVRSRSELDKDPTAAAAWDAIEGEYYAYQHGRR